MRYTYCPHCGRPLASHDNIDESDYIPFCEGCNTLLWDTFTTSVIVAVMNEYNEVAIIRQNHSNPAKYLCAYDILKVGETAEEAAVREVKEELGLDVKELKYIKSYTKIKEEILALGFVAVVCKADFVLSSDLTYAKWVTLEDALDLLHEESFGLKLVKTLLGK